jgi:NADH-quinone oxidoreductase subunit I
MGYFLDAARALRTTFRNLFRPVVTVQFPAVIRPRAERYRASFALPDDEHGEIACVGCLACEKICPSQVIKMKATGKKESPVTGKKRQYVDEFTLDLAACIQCELCVQVCNSDAIYMVREPEPPAYSREELVLTIDRLRGNARSRTAAWGRGTILQEMQEAKPKVEKPARKPEAGEGAAPAKAAPARSEVAKSEVANTELSKTETSQAVPLKSEASKSAAATPDGAKPAADGAKPAAEGVQPAAPEVPLASAVRPAEPLSRGAGGDGAEAATASGARPAGGEPARVPSGQTAGAGRSAP